MTPSQQVIEDLIAQTRKVAELVKCPNGHMDKIKSIDYVYNTGQISFSGCCNDYERAVTAAIEAN